MSIIYFCLSLFLFLAAFFFNKKRLVISSSFKRQQFIVSDLFKHFSILLMIIASINVILFALTFFISISKWIGIIDVIIILISSMIFSFKLVRYL